MNGKEIVNIDIWYNGAFVSCNWFILTLVFDDLQATARFYYQIGIKQTIDNVDSFKQIVDGNTNITGAEYQTWGESTDINDAAYVIISENLNLQLIPII